MNIDEAKSIYQRGRDFCESDSSDYLETCEAWVPCVDALDWALAEIGRLRQDIDSARRERDEANERISTLEYESGNQVYRGNSISYIHDKMTAYGKCIGEQREVITKLLELLEDDSKSTCCCDECSNLRRLYRRACEIAGRNE